MAKDKPMPGRRLKGYTFGVAVTCECGWRSSTFFGQGARGNALGEWRWHKDQCARETQNGSDRKCA